MHIYKHVQYLKELTVLFKKISIDSDFFFIINPQFSLQNI